MKSQISENLRNLSQEINRICEKAKRSPTSVSLLAVSKKKSSHDIRAAFNSGQVEFGENYVQEALKKQQELSDLKIRWHLIGHLQKNKINTIIGKFDLIHSVDSVELAEKLSKRSHAAGQIQRILLEVNIANEASKTGFSSEELERSLPQLLSYEGIEIMGLMVMPPLSDDPEKVRPYFQKAKVLFEKMKLQLSPLQRQSWQHLSMGTSSDFKPAIEEGATIIRLGTSIFGARE